MPITFTCTTAADADAFVAWCTNNHINTDRDGTTVVVHPTQGLQRASVHAAATRHNATVRT